MTLIFWCVFSSFFFLLHPMLIFVTIYQVSAVFFQISGGSVHCSAGSAGGEEEGGSGEDVVQQLWESAGCTPRSSNLHAPWRHHWHVQEERGERLCQHVSADDSQMMMMMMICLSVSVHACVCECALMCVCMCIDEHVCVCVCVCTCMCVCVLYCRP